MATGQIAAALGVLPGTVTSMLKTLDESNLATYTPYEGVRLTPAGRALALRVLRRHRLIEQFLSQTLNLTWDEVHEEAEHMEHAVSDSLVDRIDAYLGHPTTDPHGDPIPKADGTVAAAADRSLADCAAGDRFRVARVTDQSPEFLRYLSQAGLEIGAQGSLVANEPSRDSVTIRLGGDEQDALARSGRETDGAVSRSRVASQAGRFAAVAFWTCAGSRPLTTRVQRSTYNSTSDSPRAASGEGPLQWGPCEPGQGGNTAAISLRLFVWGPLTGGRTIASIDLAPGHSPEANFARLP